MMKKPEICAVIVENDLKSVKEVEKLVSLFEVRIDLIGDGWQDIVRKLAKPWIACNRSRVEGGQWPGSETDRIEELLRASKAGADIVDIELSTSGLADIIPLIRKRAKCLLSYHNFKKTPSLNSLEEIIRKQLASGADICKVVTTAQKFEDNITVLQLISRFPGKKVVSFTMGNVGALSRVLSPLLGGSFTYASIKEGKESASGQIMVRDLHRIYEMVTVP